MRNYSICNFLPKNGSPFKTLTNSYICSSTWTDFFKNTSQFYVKLFTFPKFYHLKTLEKQMLTLSKCKEININFLNFEQFSRKKNLGKDLPFFDKFWKFVYPHKMLMSEYSLKKNGGMLNTLRKHSFCNFEECFPHNLSKDHFYSLVSKCISSCALSANFTIWKFFNKKVKALSKSQLHFCIF